MIYDVNSTLFRSFLSQKGGTSADKRYRCLSLLSLFFTLRFRCFGVPFLHYIGLGFMLVEVKSEEQKPKEQRPKASENKPVMTE
ncbi:hypothetical protein ZIOFF_010620 [Zingiber officinale]|uniref:Uncharacterized protein n=1 Tax=Zingiber officinale TaxID=94328 RepID=A0A8J5I6G6_ZINOF|nr:hypothetical protein ZIOFF_010620 [Zingiber officinale]